MPQIDLVEVMKKPPGRCVICCTTPMINGRPAPAIDTNTDVDWGNNAYICIECANVIADLLGRVDEDEHQDLLTEHRVLRKSHSSLRTKYQEKEDDLKKIIEGKRAQKRNRKKIRR